VEQLDTHGPGPEHAARSRPNPRCRAEGHRENQNNDQIDRLADEPGGITAFAVFRRTDEQAGDREWQRVLSCWDGKSSGAEYHAYCSAVVQAKCDVRYGYFEIEAKPMDSAGSSAFWFFGGATDKAVGRYSNEIDVFEIGGKTLKHEHRYNMNAHVLETPKDGKNHWNRGGHWVAPFRLADDLHVYGLEWTPDVLNCHVDGILVRTMNNTHWHTPLALDFDSEAMFNWLGVPEDDDFPYTFRLLDLAEDSMVPHRGHRGVVAAG